MIVIITKYYISYMIYIFITNILDNIALHRVVMFNDFLIYVILCKYFII